MIELKITGKCVDCPAMDLTIDKMYAGDVVAMHIVRCEHEDICRRLEQRFAGEAEARNDREPGRGEAEE